MKLTTADILRKICATCTDCKHYRKETEECRSNAPLAQIMTDDNGGDYIVSFWPQVSADEAACGQFKAGN